MKRCIDCSQEYLTSEQDVWSRCQQCADKSKAVRCVRCRKILAPAEKLIEVVCADCAYTIKDTCETLGEGSKTRPCVQCWKEYEWRGADGTPTIVCGECAKKSEKLFSKALENLVVAEDPEYMELDD